MRRPVRPTFSAAAVSAAAVLTVGCYTYTPVDSAQVASGEPVRVVLTDEGSFTVARSIGPYGSSLDGRITQKDDSGFVMSVTQVKRRSGVEETWRGESVRIPRTMVSSMTLPKLSRTRSLLAAGGIVVTAMALAAALGGGSALGGRGPGGGGSGK